MTAEIQAEAREQRRRKIAQARRMSSRERLFAGAELFEMACEVSLAGLKSQHPKASENELLEELRRLVNLREKLER